MMRSLSSAVAGLRTHQTKMDVIGNNIANVNTYGFKASRTTFQDVYYQNISSGSRAQGSMSGGTNPTQIGYGSSVATIDMLITRSGSASTDRALDVFIAGEGFITAKDSSGNLIYSRLGNLRFDGEGNLVDGAGNLIQGFPMDADGNPIISPDGTITASELASIRCSPDILDRLTDIFISNTGAIIGVLPGDSEMKAATNLKFIDAGSINIGSESVYSGDVRMVVGALPQEGNAALQAIFGTGYTIDFGDKGFDHTGNYTISVESSGRITFSEPPLPNGQPGLKYTGYIDRSTVPATLELQSTTGRVAMTVTMPNPVSAAALPVIPATLPNPATIPNPAYDPDIPEEIDDPGNPGNMIPNPAYQPPTIANPGYVPGQPNPRPNPAANVPMSALRFQVTTTDKGGNIVKLPATPSPLPVDGRFDLDGLTMMLLDGATVEAQDSFSLGTAATAEGIRLPIGNLVLAKFRNAAGLEGVGGSYLAETFNSGEPIFVRPSLEGTGAVQAGYLEMSNVDLSKEFTEMITTQRGFQANSRIVSVSDEMLQELVNLKR